MSDRLFFFLTVVVLIAAVAVAIWQFRSLVWGEITPSAHTETLKQEIPV
jgi:hypothetical protein